MKRIALTIALLAGPAHAAGPAAPYYPAPHIVWDGTGGFQSTFQPTILAASLVSASGLGNDWAPMTGTGGGAQMSPNAYAGLLVCTANCSDSLRATWQPWSGSGGGGPTTFDQVGSGTNTSHGLVVGAGSVLTTAGNGVINANELNGVLLSGLATGPLCNTTSTGVPSSCTGANIATALGSTPVTNALNVPVSGVDIPATQYVPYKANNWADLSGFIVTGTTPTITNGKIVLNVAANGGITTQRLDLPIYTADDNWHKDIEFTINSLSNAANAGIVIGHLSTNTVATAGIMAVYNPSTAVSNGLSTISFYSILGTTPTLVGTRTLTTPANVNDYIRLSLFQRTNEFTVIVNNVTQGTYDVLRTAVQIQDLTGFTYQVPNMGKWFAANEGGSYTLQQMTVTSDQQRNPKLCILGDSKSAGYNGVSHQARWTNNLEALGSVGIYAGGGDMTAQVLQGVPYDLAAGCKTFLLAAIARNDIANGVPTATWQANYGSIVSQIKAVAGTKVVNMLAIPETLDQSAMNTYITTTYPTDGQINVAPGWISAYLSSDNVHPTPAGEGYLASQVAASGTIPSATVPIYNPPAPEAVFANPGPQVPTVDSYGIFIVRGYNAVNQTSAGVSDYQGGNARRLSWGSSSSLFGGFLDVSLTNSGSAKGVYWYDPSTDTVCFHTGSGPTLAACKAIIDTNGNVKATQLVTSGAAPNVITSGAVVASATTIAITSPIFHISGTAAIATMTFPTGFDATHGGCVDVIADGAWQTTTAGNFFAVMTAVPGTPYRFCATNTADKWFGK